MKTTPKNIQDFEEIANALPEQEQAIQAAMDMKLTEFAQETAGDKIEEAVADRIMGEVHKVIWMQVRGNKHKETVFTFDVWTDNKLQRVALKVEEMLELMQ